MTLQNERNLLLDLDGRLEGAAENLEGLMGKAAALHNTSEYDRLCGKREGVLLARSYIEEMLR